MYLISKKQLGIAMLKAGIHSAKELAATTGVSINTISRANNGGSVKLATLQKLACALHVDPVELLEAE